MLQLQRTEDFTPSKTKVSDQQMKSLLVRTVGVETPRGPAIPAGKACSDKVS